MMLDLWKSIRKGFNDFYCWTGLHHPQETIENRILTVTCQHCGELLYRGVI